MNSVTLLIALATWGVETGWEPVASGGLEYIIQIEPPLLDALLGGAAITSEIPPAVVGVRRYRIVVGEAQLPRIALPAGQSRAAAPADAAQAGGRPPPAVGSDNQLERPLGDRYPVSPKQRPDPSAPAGLAPPPADTVPRGDMPVPATDPSDKQTESGPGAAGLVPPLVTPLDSVRGSLPAGSARNDQIPPPSPSGFEPDPASAELEVTAHQVPDPSAGPDRAEPSPSDKALDPSESPLADSPRPWLPLTFTLLGLFTSLGGNVYLGWIAWDSRRHYRALVRQQG